MKNILTISMLIILTGCITPQEAYRGVGLIKQVGSNKVADKWLARQERQLCSVSVDAVFRRYGDNPTKLNYYLGLCGYDTKTGGTIRFDESFDRMINAAIKRAGAATDYALAAERRSIKLSTSPANRTQDQKDRLEEIQESRKNLSEVK